MTDFIENRAAVLRATVVVLISFFASATSDGQAPDAPEDFPNDVSSASERGRGSAGPSVKVFQSDVGPLEDVHVVFARGSDVIAEAFTNQLGEASCLVPCDACDVYVDCLTTVRKEANVSAREGRRRIEIPEGAGIAGRIETNWTVTQQRMTVEIIRDRADPGEVDLPRSVRKAIHHGSYVRRSFAVAADGSFRLSGFTPGWRGRIAVRPIEEVEIAGGKGLAGPFDAPAMSVPIRAPSDGVLLDVRRFPTVSGRVSLKGDVNSGERVRVDYDVVTRDGDRITFWDACDLRETFRTPLRTSRASRVVVTVNWGDNKRSLWRFEGDADVEDRPWRRIEIDNGVDQDVDLGEVIIDPEHEKPPQAPTSETRRAARLTPIQRAMARTRSGSVLESLVAERARIHGPAGPNTLLVHVVEEDGCFFERPRENGGCGCTAAPPVRMTGPGDAVYSYQLREDRGYGEGPTSRLGPGCYRFSELPDGELFVHVEGRGGRVWHARVDGRQGFARVVVPTHGDSYVAWGFGLHVDSLDSVRYALRLVPSVGGGPPLRIPVDFSSAYDGVVLVTTLIPGDYVVWMERVVDVGPATSWEPCTKRESVVVRGGAAASTTLFR
jgi:hypothetical protein